MGHPYTFLALGSNVWAQNQAQTRTQDPLKM